MKSSDGSSTFINIFRIVPMIRRLIIITKPTTRNTVIILLFIGQLTRRNPRMSVHTKLIKIMIFFPRTHIVSNYSNNLYGITEIPFNAKHALTREISALRARLAPKTPWRLMSIIRYSDRTKFVRQHTATGRRIYKK